MRAKRARDTYQSNGSVRLHCDYLDVPMGTNVFDLVMMENLSNVLGTWTEKMEGG